MKAKTIGQYAIMKWLNQEFEEGCLKIEFTGANQASVEDAEGGKAKVVFDPVSKTVMIT